GIHVYQAAFEVEGDTIEDNNRAVGTIVVRGRPQVLLADKDKSHAQSLAGALRSQNIEVTVVEPPQVPKDVAGLQKYDGGILSNDRSGSMAMSTDEKVTKLDLAKEAAHLVVDLLDERNEVAVMSWDTEFLWDVPIRAARDKGAIHHAIATIKAGGGTDGYPALKESYAVLFDRPALLKHVIFLSDGQMTRGDFAGLLRRMAKDKITVSTVAIGKDADLQLMVDVAKWGRGRFYYTE